jgi:hypothetical protein
MLFYKFRIIVKIKKNFFLSKMSTNCKKICQKLSKSCQKLSKSCQKFSKKGKNFQI